MFASIRRWLFGGSAGKRVSVDLPSVPREQIAHLLLRPDGLARVDWGMANSWIGRQTGADPDAWRRAVMAACLDEVRDSLPRDHRRWRSANVEGLAPLEGRIGPAMAAVAERAFTVLGSDLRVIRGDAPIPPVAIVAIEPNESYLDFTSSYFPDEGAFATSGGLCLNEGEDAFALIAVNAGSRRGCEVTVAHELTHHALRGGRLPLWMEEGFTQMMEERVVHVTNFILNEEMTARQRDHWSEHDIAEFLDGAAFHSPEEDTQELAYHLSQWVVRSELSRRPKEFFRFARACRDRDPDDACQEAIGVSPRELVLGIIGIEE